MALTVVGYTGRRGTQCSRLYKERGYSMQKVTQGKGALSVVDCTGKGGTQCRSLHKEREHSV